jgi:ankyrin repeat protein
MGADVNSRARDGSTNLMHACLSSDTQEDFCLALIRAGADVRLADEVKVRGYLLGKH